MNARDRFTQTRAAVKRLHEVQLLIMNDCDDWKPPTIKAHNEASDPTATRAAYNVDELADKLESLRREESELLDFIGTSLKLIDAVRVGFGEIYATLLMVRYVDCWKWARIKDEYGIPRSTGHYLLGIVFDWIDSIGVSRLLSEDYEL